MESARLLANDAIQALGGRAEEERVRRLADEFVSTGGQGDVAAFLAWLADRDPTLARHAPNPSHQPNDPSARDGGR